MYSDVTNHFIHLTYSILSLKLTNKYSRNYGKKYFLKIQLYRVIEVILEVIRSVWPQTHLNFGNYSINFTSYVLYNIQSWILIITRWVLLSVKFRCCAEKKTVAYRIRLRLLLCFRYIRTVDWFKYIPRSLKTAWTIPIQVTK